MSWTVRLLVLIVGVGAVAGVVYRWFDFEREGTPHLPPVTGDALVFRTGGYVTGTLESCAVTYCVFDRVPYGRRDVEWIALDVRDAVPPPIEARDRDEIHLRAGGVVAGPLFAIDADAVFSPRGGEPRESVSWIHLADSGVPDGVGGVRRSEDEAGDASATSAPHAVPPPGPAVAAPPGRAARGPWEDPVRRCEEDEPLGAQVRLREIYENRGDGYDCRAEATFAFRLATNHPDWPAQLYQTHTSESFHYRVRNFGCRDVNVSGVTIQQVCSQPAGPELTGFQAGGDQARFTPVDPELGLPRLPDEVTDASVAPGECVQSDGNGRGGLSWRPALLGTISANNPQPDEVLMVEVPESGCHDANFASTPDCLRRPDYYAVIPMSGHRTKRSEASYARGDRHEMTYTWAACCGCADAESAPALPERGPPTDEQGCAPPRNESVKLDLALDQLAAYARALRPLEARVNALAANARNFEGDFEHAMRDCRLWSAAKFLTQVLASGGAPGLPGRSGFLGSAGEVAQTKAFSNLLSTIEKILANDASWLLPNTEFAGWVSAEDAWDGLQTVIGAAGPSSPAVLREGLAQCGAPTIDAVLDDANKYLNITEELLGATRAMNEHVNRMMTKDNEITGLWLDYQRACRAYQSCTEGGDPGRCDALPRMPAL